MPTIIDIIDEPERGCGFRKTESLYLRADGPGAGCGKLPVILDICPCCGNGIKFARSWTWIDPSRLMETGDCGEGCLGEGCSLFRPPIKAGLLWIGERFYKTPSDWLTEAHEQGVSRRIQSLPHGFKIGEHWVMTAHKKAREDVCDDCEGSTCAGAGNDDPCPSCKGKGKVWKAGIFHVFKPSRVEYIVSGKESEEELERLEARGFTLVRLTRTDAKEARG